MRTRAFPTVFLAVIGLAFAATATAQTISIPALPQVGAGLEIGPFSLTLSTAQHGGVTVHIASSDPAIALVSSAQATIGTASVDVFVPNGSTTVSFWVHGLEDTTGTATIAGSAPGFTGASRPATVVRPALELSGLVTSLDTLDPADAFLVRVGIANPGGTALGTVQLVRAGSGLTATVTNSNAAVGVLQTTASNGQLVTVPIAAGQFFSPSSVVGGGVAFDGLTVGTSTVAATIPGFTATTAATQAVSVTQPILTMTAISNVGSGLQGGNQFVQLSASEHGGVTIRVVSSDSSVALLSPNGSTAGKGSIDIFLPNGQTSGPFVVSGLENAIGTSTISASTPSFTGASQPASIVHPAADLLGLVTTLDTLDPDDLFQIRVGTPSGGAAGAQNLRIGGPGAVATIISSNATVGELVTTPSMNDTVVVTIAAGTAFSANSVAFGGVAFRPHAAGVTTVSATVPGFTAVAGATQNVTVTQPTMSINPIGTVGAGLMGLAQGINLSASQHGGITIHIASSDTTIALVSPNVSTPGTGFIDVPVANGVASASFVVHGKEGVVGSSTISVSAPGFGSASAPAAIVQAAVDLTGLATSISSIDPADPFQVRVGYLSGGGVASQNLRVGSPGAVATVINSNPAVGHLVKTAGPADTVTVFIPAGNFVSPNSVAAGGVAFDGIALGASTVSATIPGFVATPASIQSVTVTQPILTLTPLDDLGSGLQGSQELAQLSSTQHGGLTVHLQVSDSTLARLAPSATSIGHGAIDVAIANGTGSVSFFVQAMENVTGTVTVTVSAPGFIGASRSEAILPPALELFGLVATTDVDDPDDLFQIRVGLPNSVNSALSVGEAARFGGPGFIATIVSSNESAGTLVTTAGSNDTVQVTIAPGASTSAGTVATGGVAFNGVGIGTTLVSARIPGLIPTGAATQSVTVIDQIVTMSQVGKVGAGLQSGSLTATLGIAQHGGVTMHVASANPALALVSPGFATPGTASFDVAVPNGVSQVSFYVHGREDTVGTVTITASAPGFAAANRAAEIVRPGAEIVELSDFLDVLAPSDPFMVRVGVPTSDHVTLQTFQTVRAGAAPMIVTLASSDPAAGTLVTLFGSGSPATVSIPAGLSQSPADLASGGVEFDPLGIGMTIVSAAIPGGLGLQSSQHTVIVTTQPTATTVQWSEVRWDDDRAAVVIAWRLLEERADRGFVVSRRHDDGLWETLDGSVVRDGRNQSFVDASVEPGVRYTYRVDVVEGGSIVTSFDADVAVPSRELALAPNSPNPFRVSTRIRFTLPRATHVEVGVFDVRGRRVASVIDRSMPAGPAEVEWNGRDASGAGLGAGIYWCRLVADGKALNRRMVLVR